MAKSPRPASKSQMFTELSQKTGLSRKDVAKLFDEYTNLIKREVGKKGPGVVTLPGLLKIKRVHKDPTPERQGINPLTREPMIIKAKPARTVVKVQALKSLKEMVK